MKQARSQARYQVRLATSPADLSACLDLRAKMFRAGAANGDRDAFDERCEHVLIESVEGRQPVGCFRFLYVNRGTEIDRSYSAQFYELSALNDFPHPMIEMGRFCTDPDVRDPDVLRAAWGAMARIVEERKVELLFGCSSFQGVDADKYSDAFAMLKERHIGPKHWMPRIKAPRVFEFARRLRRAPDPKAAMKAMPPLLKTYLAMGGWVSDHAVVDRDLDTLHVFTGVEIQSIPPARRRSILSAS